MLAAKREREVAEEAARAEAAAAALEAAAVAEREAAEAREVSPDLPSSESECEILPEPHPTNPFLAVSGDVLVPIAAASNCKPRQAEHGVSHQDIVNDFDAQNSNPFDGAELQSLSNFDALKSVLAPDHTHDLAFLGQPVSSRTSPASNDSIYATIVNEIPSSAVSSVISTTVTNGTSAEPIYSTVNKSRDVIKSKKLVHQNSDIIPVSNGPSIHSSFAAVSLNSGWEGPSPCPPTPPRQPTPPRDPSPPSVISPFPKIPEEVVARAMQRLDHNQEKCFLFLKEVLEVMTRNACSAEVAEAASLLESTEQKRDERCTLVKQFAQLGFNIASIVSGLRKHPNDRDELLDYLFATS